jgi:uncharacterized protein
MTKEKAGVRPLSVLRPATRPEHRKLSSDCSTVPSAVTAVVADYMQSLDATTRRVADDQWGLSIDDVGGWPLHVGVALRDGLLRAQAEVLGPDGGASDHELLVRNRRLALVRFAHTGAGAVWVQGELVPSGVDPESLDRLLGLLVAAATELRTRRPAPAVSPALDRLGGRFAVCRLEPDAAVPDWAWGDELTSITRTASELSVVCPWDAVPDGVRALGPYAALAVRGPLDPGLVGFLAGLAGTLARAAISVFALATFDTDLLLVEADDAARACAALRAAGYEVEG